MASRKSKRVSFDNSSKIVEITEENESEFSESVTISKDEFDPDSMNIDLTTGKKRRNIGQSSEKSSSSGGGDSKEEFTVPLLTTSWALVPYHLLLLLFNIVVDGTIMEDVREGVQKAFYGLSVLSLIFAVLVNEAVKGEKTKNARSDGPTNFEFFYVALSFPLSIMLSVPVYLTFLLFGAPAGRLNALTFYLASHVSVIAFYPLLNVYKFTDKNAKKIWWKLLTFQVANWKFNQVYCTAIGTLVGCWLGVLPIPLDWDRDWQDWPITVLFGAYAGGFLGGLASYAYGCYVYSKMKSRIS